MRSGFDQLLKQRPVRHPFSWLRLFELGRRAGGVCALRPGDRDGANILSPPRFSALVRGRVAAVAVLPEQSLLG